jgi:hypothetical protein
MPGTAIYQDLEPLELPLASIFLDPNNPRFVGPNWQRIEDKDIDLEQIQENVRVQLVRSYGIDKLRMNMEVNGYLPIDRVVVRKFKPGRYVVLEGNRRICAAKMITAVGMDGTTVSEEVLRSLRGIPCLEYVGSEQNAAWIFQGLRHIAGIAEWSAYNKAHLLVEQMEREGLPLTDAGRKFGLTPFGAGQWVRGYYAFKQAKEESDYVTEVDERSYPYFQELFSKSSIKVREWMGWDTDTYRFNDPLRFNEFIGWLYPRPETVEGASDSKGDWERRRLYNRDGVRLLAYLISKSEKYFEQFRGGMELETAYTMANAEAFQQKTAESADRVKDLFEAIAACSKALDDIPLKVLKDKSHRKHLDERLAELQHLIDGLKDFPDAKG